MLPNPLYVLLTDNRYFRVDHAASVNDTDVNFKPGTTYRNELSGGYVGGSNLASDATSGSFIKGYNYAFQSADEVFNHTAPHVLQTARTERQFLAAALSLAGITVSGSTSITVPNSDLVSVGQAISGSGIPSGSLIAEITSETVIKISAAATASASITMTVGGTDILARCWVDEFVEYSLFPPQLAGRIAILWPSS